MQLLNLKVKTVEIQLDTLLHYALHSCCADLQPRVSKGFPAFRNDESNTVPIKIFWQHPGNPGLLNRIRSGSPLVSWNL